MDFVAAIKDVHTTAVEHGWWDTERGTREAVALMHSELSEALEQARMGRPMMYSNPEKPEKMEGVGVELIDCVIRVMDFMGHYNIEYIPKSLRVTIDLADDPLPILVCMLHAMLSTLFGLCAPDSTDVGIDIDTGKIKDDVSVGFVLSDVIDAIFGWLRNHGTSPESIFNEKAEYNKSRPYKHGKAF